MRAQHGEDGVDQTMDVAVPAGAELDQDGQALGVEPDPRGGIRARQELVVLEQPDRRYLQCRIAVLHRRPGVGGFGHVARLDDEVEQGLAVDQAGGCRRATCRGGSTRRGIRGGRRPRAAVPGR